MRISWILLLLVSAAVQAQSTLTAFTNVNLIDTRTGKINSGSTVLVEGDRIKEVGKTGKVKIPAGAAVTDGTGKWLMPGMIDGHIHFFQSGGLYTRPDALNLGSFYSYEKDQQWIKDNRADLMRRYLACGVTSVIDVGGPFSNFDVRNYCNGNSMSPNAFVTGPLISTYQPPNLDKKDPPIVKVKNEEEARELVKKQLPYQPDFIKIWYIVLPGQDAEKTLPVVKAAIEEAHANGLRVSVHATEFNTAKLAVSAGADILVHSVDDKVLDAAFIALLREKKVTYIPTLIVASKYRQTFGQQHVISQHEFMYSNPFMLGTLFDMQHLTGKEVPFDYKKMRNRMPVLNGEDTIMWTNLKLLADAGVNIGSGTDAGNIGTQHAASYLPELLAMQKAGMSNMQVLQASTFNLAKGFGKDSLIGSIEKGKLADFLLLDRNPAENLTNLDSAMIVVHRGRIIRRDTLLRASPEMLAQQQLNAYNNRDIEAFLAPYSDSVELYEYPAKLMSKGKEQMRKDYSSMFKQVPALHCQLVNRMVQGNTVIDQEHVTGFGGQGVKAIAIYKIGKGKIQQVYFIQ